MTVYSEKPKSAFLPQKLQKKRIFERGALKIFQNGRQIHVQHEKIYQNSEVLELFGNFGPALP